MKKKMLFFDIDGTILTQKGRRYVPESTPAAIKALQANGHLCFINTGRTLAEIKEDISSLGFDGFVCGCGTNITYHGEILLFEEFPQPLADEIMRDLNKFQLEWVLEGKDNVYYSTEPYTTHIGDFHDEFSESFPNATHDIAPGTRGLHFDKLCICLTPESDFDSFYSIYEKKLTFIDRGDSFYEIVPHGFSKASGIRFLMDYFNIAREDTIALGDSTNDLTMMEYAGYSIAMKESDPPVLEIADYVTDTVEANGIAKALKHLMLI